MLYLVATPIGNLGDISHRAVETLKQSDYILCEDTRYSRRLLQHVGVDKPLKSYHTFNAAKREEEVIADLRQGKQISLLSDAGTPLICDPGERLITRCRQEHLPYSAIPGPCAAIMALVLSAMETSRFQFVGFLPKKEGGLKQTLEEMLSYKGTSIAYETPHRIRKSLAVLEKLAPHCHVVVARELTKKFEEILTGTPGELSTHFSQRSPKGEIVLLLANKESIC